MAARAVITGIKFLWKSLFLKNVINDNLADFEVIDADAQFIVLSEAVQELCEEEESIKRYNRPQILRALLGYFAKIQQNMETAARLDEVIIKIYKTFRERLYSRHLLTMEMAIGKLIDKRDIFTEFNELIFDNVYYLTPLEQKFIEYLVKPLKNFVIFLEYNDKIPGLAFARQTFEFYRNVLGISDVIDLFDIKPYTRDLFSYKIPYAGEIPDRIELQRYNDIDGEVESIARQIKRLVINNQAELSEITVIAADLALYDKKIQEKFTDYGITVDISKGYPLKISPFLSLLNKFFDIKTSNRLKITDIRDIIFSGYTRIDDKKYKGITKKQIYKILSRIELKKYRKREFLNKVMQQSESVGNISEPRAAAEFFRALNDLMKEMSSDITVEQFIFEIDKFFKFFDIDKGILQGFNENLEQLEKNLHIFRKVDEVLKRMKEIMRFAQEPKRSFNRFVTLFKMLAGHSEYHIVPKPHASLRVIGLYEYRGYFSKYIFLLGAVDENLPSFKYGASQFSDFKEEYVRRMGESRYLFTNYLYRFSEKLVCSFYTQQENKEMVISQFVQELLDFAKISDIDYKSNVSAEKPAIGGKDAGKFVYSENEYLLNLIGAPSEWANLCHRKRMRLEQASALADIFLKRQDVSSPFGEFEGIIGAPMSAKLCKFFLSENNDDRYNFGAYDLSALTFCPMKFFFKKLLHLNDIEEPVDEPESKDIGTAFHKIFKKFYEDIHKENDTYSIADIPDAVLKRKIKDIASAVFDTQIKTLFVNPAFYQAYRLKYIDDTESDTNIADFIEQEKMAGSTPFLLEHPGIFEYKGFRLKVRFDRIDTTGDGGFVVIDYKGNKTAARKFRDRFDIQIPLYMFLLDKNTNLLDKNTGIFNGNIAGGSVLSYTSYCKRAANPQFPKKAIEKVSEIMPEIFGKIMKGEYHYTRNEYARDTGNPCNFCEFKNICYVNYEKQGDVGAE